MNPNRIPQKLARLGWNKRILSLDDFYAACEDDDVIVIEARLPWPGAYVHHQGRPAILLDNNLRGWEQTLVAWQINPLPPIAFH